MRFKRSLIVGKFAPLHAGHLFLIRTALAESSALTVLVYSNPDFREMGQDVRAGWLREASPSADVRTPHDPPPDSADDHTHRIFVRDYLLTHGISVDAVFTSEDYGDGFARVLGVPHRMVDRQRMAFPVSGRLLRGDLPRFKDYLAEPAKRHFLGRGDAN